LKLRHYPLAQVIEVLRKDSVPCDSAPSSRSLASRYALQNAGAMRPEPTAETVLTNWFPITKLGEVICVYSIERPLSNPLTEPAKIASDHPLPMTADLRRLITFGDFDEVQAPIVESTLLSLNTH